MKIDEELARDALNIIKKTIDLYNELLKENQNNLQQAISLLKQCVNYDNKPMTTAISGELADKIREFIGRYE